jgi:hypothetical protein
VAFVEKERNGEVIGPLERERLVVGHLNCVDVAEGGVVAEHLGVDEAEEELLHLAAWHVGVGEAALEVLKLTRDDAVLLRLGARLADGLDEVEELLGLTHPPCDPIASSRPIVRSCSIAGARSEFLSGVHVARPMPATEASGWSGRDLDWRVGDNRGGGFAWRLGSGLATDGGPFFLFFLFFSVVLLILCFARDVGTSLFFTPRLHKKFKPCTNMFQNNVSRCLVSSATLLYFKEKL